MVINETTALVAGRVEASRRAADIPRLQLAEVSGIARTTLARKLDGHMEFKLSELTTLSRCLGANFSEWLQGVGEVTP